MESSRTSNGSRVAKKVEVLATNPVYGGALVVIVGCLLGSITAGQNHLPFPYNYVSSTIGWVYFTAWSISFYPQVYSNWKRASVVGLSFDFELYNLLGFTTYSIFNCAFYWDPVAQAEYRRAHDGQSNAVQLNDVYFSLHAVVITIVTLWQCLIYERGSQWFSNACLSFVIGATVLSLVFALVLRFELLQRDWITYLNFLYFLSYIKLLVSLIKYIPQAFMNYERKSTVGWNIWNVLLDFTGGTLSVIQLLLDAQVQHDWSAVTGNPAKLLLGNIGMFFDIVFMVQHYILYKENAGVIEPLLPTSVNRGNKLW